MYDKFLSAKLLINFINRGCGLSLETASQKAGARGGTILNARGTSTEDDVQFFGVSLAPEKELLIIISEADQSTAIFQTLSSQPVFSEPGGGIIFTTNVEQLITLGK